MEAVLKSARQIAEFRVPFAGYVRSRGVVGEPATTLQLRLDAEEARVLGEALILRSYGFNGHAGFIGTQEVKLSGDWLTLPLTIASIARSDAKSQEECDDFLYGVTSESV